MYYVVGAKIAQLSDLRKEKYIIDIFYFLNTNHGMIPFHFSCG